VKRFKFLVISGAALVIAMFLAGCASVPLQYLETGTVDGPKQVRQGTNINPREITIWGIYKDGTRKVVSIIMTVASPPKTVLFKQDTEPDPKWPGLQVRGEWDQMGSDVDVRSMTNIQILQAPKKLNYIQGDTLDLTGLKVLGLWEAFTSEELPVAKTDVTGYNPDNVGTQQVTVTKNKKSAFFNVEVVALTSLELDKPPTKTVYTIGEPLDLTGIIVYGNYTGSDPTKRRRELIPVNQFTNVSGYDSSRIGNQQKVTITVRKQIVNFFVDIIAAAPPER
jgi:hypothetical protein